MLDTSHSVETPENVDLNLTVAGPLVRANAWVIDFFVRLFIGGFALIVLAALGTFGIGIALLVMFLLEWGYPIWFEVKRDGATPGKRVMGIRVVQRNGAPVGWGPSVLRNLLRTADFLPVGYGFGLLSILFSGSFRRLGDLAAGTVVIRSQVVAPALRGRDVPPTPPAATLELSEQRTIIDFAQRVPQLPPARARELASIAAPVLQSNLQTDRVWGLCSVAAWLQGKRPVATDQASKVAR